MAKVIPLFKSGKEDRFSNYRPISLLSQFLKILKKLFNSRLTDFVEKCHILSDCQYGFRNNRSTSLALLQLTEEISSAIDCKLSTI